MASRLRATADTPSRPLPTTLIGPASSSRRLKMVNRSNGVERGLGRATAQPRQDNLAGGETLAKDTA